MDPEKQKDTSVTGWMIMCLVLAKDFDIEIDEQDIRDVLDFIDEMTDESMGGTGYKSRGSYSAREAGDETI